MIFRDCELYLNGSFFSNYWLEIENEKIKDYGSMDTFSFDSSDKEIISLNNSYLVPGFIDQHIHGAMGHDFMDGDIDGLDAILSYLPSEGVTSVLATTTTSEEEAILKALEVIGSYEARAKTEILGIHLEGPYLSHKAAGAHRKELFVKPSIEHFKMLQKVANNKIKLVTLAVENDENHELIKYLSKENIVASIGHTAANYDQAKEAFESGCTCVTHCYNAMTSLHHREPGVVGLALDQDGLKAEIISDLIHVHEKAINIVHRSKKNEDIILITDAMRAKGLDKGSYDLGGQMVYSDGNSVKTDAGNLAGSILKLDNAILNYQKATNCSLENIIKMITENPAKLLNVYHKKGSIDRGKDADLVVLSENLEVMATYCKGMEVYKNYDNSNNR